MQPLFLCKPEGRIYTASDIKIQQGAYRHYDNQRYEIADQVYLIFAAHEIRDEKERDIFFQEVKRVLKPDGQIIITEHLRDFSNFMAYTIGFFHFMPKKNWEKNFRSAGLSCVNKVKSTPFVTTFILEKNGTTA